MKNPSTPKADRVSGAVGAKPSSSSTGTDWQTIHSRIGFWITLVAAVAYCTLLGAHWLPLGWSSKEMSASASRVWDIQREWSATGHLPWWTPNFMSGSSHGLNYTRGFYLLPWMFLSRFAGLEAAGKLMELAALFASAIAMYFCARHFLKHDWAAALAALAFMLHPRLLISAAGAEHITISLFYPLIPLLWLTFARVLETNRFRDVFWCALVAAIAFWTDNKQALLHGLFLVGYLIYWFWPAERRRAWRSTARTVTLIVATATALGAFIIVPGAMESKYVKLFAGDPIREWQKTYSLKSLFGIVDRNGVVSASARDGVIGVAQKRGGFRSQTEFDQFRQLAAAATTDSPEKYAGLVWVAALVVTILFNARRTDRRLFWFFVALLLASVALASGVHNVWTANFTLLGVWLGLDGVPVGARLAALLALAALAAFLWLFWKRKLTTTRKLLVAVGVLAAFLFVPAFDLVSLLPLFKEIRAPYVFYDGPEVFLGAMLIGFFATDALAAEKWRAHIPKIVVCMALLLFLDYWPYQKPMKDNGVPAHTLQNMETTYSSFRNDPDWVKTYSMSGRYFHLLGPMYGGKPQVYEAFYNWMCPTGIGLLNQQAFSSWDNHRAFLNLMGARYVVFDKTDPDMQSPQTKQILDAYKQTFPVALENEDFTVFRNDGAHPYVTGYARTCLFDGDFRNTAQLALALATRNLPLVHGSARVDATAKYERVYRDGEAPLSPLRNGETVLLADVRLERQNAQRVRIRLTAPRDCLAVIAESYYPYWRAEIDNRPTEVLRVSCGLMGLNVPTGAHEIVLRYEPPRAYALAGVVSLLALVGCGLAARRCKS